MRKCQLIKSIEETEENDVENKEQELENFDLIGCFAKLLMVLGFIGFLCFMLNKG